MNIKNNYFPLIMAIMLAISIVSPTYTMKKWQAGIVGAGITAATILAIEHFLAPLIADTFFNANEKQLAHFAQKRAEIQEIQKHHDEQQSSIDSATSEDLLHSKQTIAKDLRTIQNTCDQLKSSKLQSAALMIKEIEECKNQIRQHDKALDQAIARSISDEAYAHFKEELERSKSPEGLDADTLERIIAENHIREPYRRHAYLNVLDQYIERCKQLKAPSIVTNSLEVLRKNTSRLLAPLIVQEQREFEDADRRTRDFEIEIAGKRSIKDFFDAAKQDLAQSRAAVDESRHQIAEFAAAMQQQCFDNSRAVANSTAIVQNATGLLIQANQEQQQIKQRLEQLDRTVQEQGAMTRTDVQNESANIKRYLTQMLGTASQQTGAQGSGGPSAPPYEP